MCGRITISVNYEEMKDHLIDFYDIKDFDTEYKLPRYNVAPGQNILAIINDGTNNRVGMLKWGFVPFFAKDEKVGYSMINAKSETIADKPAFRTSFKNKRCIILADSFYEWKKEENNKTPMRILLKDKSIFPLAGLWSSYTRNDGTKLYTCTIITTNANSLVANIHDRMPVILTKENKDIWLNPNFTDINYLSSLLVPYESNMMYTYEVSSIVNSALNDKIECINSL